MWGSDGWGAAPPLPIFGPEPAAPQAALAYDSGPGWATSGSACPRPAAGSVVGAPPEFVSEAGRLDVALSYQSAPDEHGNPKFCYMMRNGDDNPLLRVEPGGVLSVDLRNDVMPPNSSVSPTQLEPRRTACGMVAMDATSTNLHFHGLSVSPTCPADDVFHTIINAGEIFRYEVALPRDSAPGLFWYHPHAHGLADAAVQGGASGPIIVEGIERLQPAVAGLPETVLVIRDIPLPEAEGAPPERPAWDLSLNDVPIRYPDYTPAVLPMRPQEKQFWRVLNAAADSILDLVVSYDQKPQTLEIVALDGAVLFGDVNGTVTAQLRSVDHVMLPPAARAEFMVTGPAKEVTHATLSTREVDTGPDGDSDPLRPLATIDVLHDALRKTLPPARAAVAGAPAPDARPIPGPGVAPSLSPVSQGSAVTRQRRLYFSEQPLDPAQPKGPATFFITEEGAPRAAFNVTDPPAIVTQQGAVEEWTIENRARERHVFHSHQLHFTLLEENGRAIARADQISLDTIDVDYWDGQATTYPSVKLRFDFSGSDVGRFVYHCHILQHEDAGMMATIQVDPVAHPERGVR